MVGVLIVVFGLGMRTGRMELSIEIYDPAIPLLVIYPNEGTQTNNIPVFTAVLFTIAKKQEATQMSVR